MNLLHHTGGLPLLFILSLPLTDGPILQPEPDSAYFQSEAPQLPVFQTDLPQTQGPGDGNRQSTQANVPKPSRNFSERKSFMNVKELPTAALRRLMMGKPKTREVRTETLPAKPLEVGMYRVQQSMKMRLIVGKKAGDVVHVRLLNERGEAIYSEMLNRRMMSYARDFDFTNIPDGRYTMEVTRGNEVVHKDIQLRSVPVKKQRRTLVY